MSEIVHVTDHADQAVANLIGQYQDRPRLEAFIRAIVKQLQDIEDALWDIYVQSALDNAANAELDIIGDIVGQKRQGLDDTNYRVFIKARIRTNLSDGKMAQLIVIAKLVLGSRIYARTYKGSVLMWADDVGVNAFILWRDFLARAKGSTKSIFFGYSKQPAASTIKRGSFYAGHVLPAAQCPGSVWSTAYGGGKTAGIFG